MAPTNELRWVKRVENMHPFYKTVGPDGFTERAVQISMVLQQKWVGPGMKEEWRDLPVFEEYNEE